MKNAKVIPMKKRATWDGVRQSWAAVKAKGLEAVLQAAATGAMLIELKESCEHGEFQANLSRVKDLTLPTAGRLMTLSRNVALIAKHKPESQAEALRLIYDAEEPKRAKAEKDKITLLRAKAEKDDDTTVEDDDELPPIRENEKEKKQRFEAYHQGFEERVIEAQGSAEEWRPDEDYPVTAKMVKQAEDVIAAWKNLVVQLSHQLRKQK